MTGQLLGILVTFNRPAALSLALSRIVGASTRPDRLIVVDNAPTAETAHRVEELNESWIEHLASEQNLGPAGGRARGMEHLLPEAADEDWFVIFDDDDPLPHPDVLRSLKGFAADMVKSDGSVAGVGLQGGVFDWHRGRPRPIAPEWRTGPVQVDHLYGGFFPFFRVGAVRSVGPFSASLFYGLEELEFGLRLCMAGFSLYEAGHLWRRFVPLMGHPPQVTKPSLWLSPANAHRYYILRNLIFILRSHRRYQALIRVIATVGIAKPLLNFPRTPRLTASHLRLNATAIRDGLQGNLGPARGKYALDSPSRH